MAQATLSQPVGIPASVASKLRGLRMKINTWLLIDGVSRVLAATAVLLVVFFVLDYGLSLWSVDFDFSLRLGCLVIGCAFVGYLIYRGLVVPFSARVSDDALVLAVEKHYGQELGESVISAVQFSRMSNEIEVQGVSPQLVRATIDQGMNAANRVPFGSVVDTRWFTANIAIFAIAAIMLGFYAYGASAFRGTQYAEPIAANEFEFGGRMHSVQVLGIAFDREVLLKDTPWPQDVYYNLNVGDEKVILFPRGDDFVLEVTLDEKSKSSPDDIKELRINVIGSSGRFSEALVRVEKSAKEKPAAAEVGDAAAGADSTAAAGDEMQFDHFLFELPNVREDFRFQLEAKGVRGKSDWFEVNLIDRPQIDELKLAYELPQYAGGKDVPLPAGAGPHHILRGSNLKIEGTASKPLTEVQIRFGEYASTFDVNGEKSFSHVIPNSAFAKTSKGNDSGAAANATSPTEKVQDGIHSGVVTIDLWDSENILIPGESEPGPLKSKPSTKFSLRIKPDRGPDVMARLENISGMVTPGATIPFDCLIKDEYAVTEVTLHYKWKHEENEAQHGEGQLAFDSIKSKLGQNTIRFGEDFDLAPLEIPTGSGLSFHIAAKDNNDISGPGEGKSTIFLLRIVTQTEFQRDIIRRQIELHQDFKRLHEQQIKMLDDTDVLRAETRDAASMSPKQRQKLMDLQKDHKLLETNIGGVARRMESIVQEMQNNRLEESESVLIEKLQNNVIKPMQELAQGEVDQAIRQLDRVRSAENKQQQRDEALEKAIAQQQRNEQKMENILKNMAKTEGYQEVVSLLYEVIGDSDKVKELIEKERQRLLEDAFEGDGEGDKDNGQ